MLCARRICIDSPCIEESSCCKDTCPKKDFPSRRKETCLPLCNAVNTSSKRHEPADEKLGTVGEGFTFAFEHRLIQHSGGWQRQRDRLCKTLSFVTERTVYRTSLQRQFGPRGRCLFCSLGYRTKIDWVNGERRRRNTYVRDGW